MKFKLNWGAGIVVAIIVFMSFIITLSVKMLNNNTELVRKDYYQIAENYQSRIDARNNLTESGFSPQIKTSSNQIIISWDPSLGKPNKANLYLSKPDNQKLDIELSSFHLSDSNELIFNSIKMESGIWNLECIVMVNSTEYFFSKKLIIQ